MDELTFAFEPENLKKLRDEDIEISEFIWTVLTKRQIFEEESPEDIVKSKLLSYENQDGGSPEIDQLTVAESEFFGAKGSVTFEYCVHFFYGCSDRSPIHERYEKINFSIKNKEKCLTFLFPKIDPRTTKYEF